MQNLREALERMLNRRHATLCRLPPLVQQAMQEGTIVVGMPAAGALRTPSASERVTSAVARDRRFGRYTAVCTLSAQGLHMLQIAKR